MSANAQDDKEISQLMARNRRGNMLTAAFALVVIVGSVVALAIYFSTVLATAP